MNKRSHSVTAKVSQELKDEIDRIAKEARWTVSQAVAVLIEEALQQRAAVRKDVKKK
jgi:antitoxin component of RelBE/YafQ-DinJ toxin-antitoxin module